MEELKAKVRADLERNAANRSRNETEDSILSAIAKFTTAELPDALIEMQEEQFLRRLEQNLEQQEMRAEDYYSYIGTSREEYKKKFEEDARKVVMNQIVLEALIDQLKLEATEEEIAEVVAKQAASVGKEPEVYRKGMDPRQFEYIAAEIKVKKLFEYLEANNEMVKPEEAKA